MAAKLSNTVRATLAVVADLAEPAELEPKLTALSAGKTVRCDRATAPDRLVRLIEGASGKAALDLDPIAKLKACKNPTEIAGARAAHLRDGAALARFLAFVDAAPVGSLDEIEVVAALETFRRDTGKLKNLSFRRSPAPGQTPRCRTIA